ncbi:MAG: hypothetical protein HC921_21590 [Synechococcaceae cyanobacterium SM2_3_1]|nr:hypothetical protein [Synechococcaceae cyanobacterium SM2_3_1]
MIKNCLLVFGCCSILGFLILSLSGCGGDGAPVSIVPPQPDNISSVIDDPLQPLTTSLIGEEEGEGITLSETFLTDAVVIDSKAAPMETAGKYWITWEDAQLGYLSIAKSGTTIDVPGYPPEIPVELLFPFIDDIDPEEEICEEPNRRELVLSEVFIEGGGETNDGETETLIIRDVFQRTEEGDIITDLSGNRPPVTINITVPTGNATVTDPVGRTDSQGNYRTIVILNEDLGKAELNVRASVVPPQGLPLEAVKKVDLEDPCTLEDLDEVFTCAVLGISIPITLVQEIEDNTFYNVAFFAALNATVGEVSVPIFDGGGNYLPLDVTVSPLTDNVVVQNGTGTTDENGIFSGASYSLLENLGAGQLLVELSFTTPAGQVVNGSTILSFLIVVMRVTLTKHPVKKITASQIPTTAALMVFSTGQTQKATLSWPVPSMVR